MIFLETFTHDGSREIVLHYYQGLIEALLKNWQLIPFISSSQEMQTLRLMDYNLEIFCIG